MVFTLGVILIGGHFLVSAAVANHLSAHHSWGALLLFMAFAAASGVVVIKIQNKLERIMIGRHVRERPNSGWRVVIPEK